MFFVSFSRSSASPSLNKHMEAAKNFSQGHRLLLGDHNSSPDANDPYRTLNGELIIFTAMAAMITMSLCLVVLLIYKCLSRSNRSSDESPTDVNPKPSIDDELASIPVCVYEKSTLPSSQPSCPETSSGLENCAICLEDYVLGDKVRVLPKCKHFFHKKCIEEWFQVPSLHCPTCREQVLDHCLQSSRSNYRNQRDGIASPFPLLAFGFGGIRYAAYSSGQRNFS